MNKKYIKFIKQIQNQILNLLPQDKLQQKAFLLRDCCSELSRLVASWISDADQSNRHVILKGSNVCDTDKSHDILASIKNDKVYLIDPTIWQFFPNESTILVGEYGSLDQAIAAATEKYGGDWQKSQDLNGVSQKERDKWLKIVKENIDEALSNDQT